MHPQFLARFCGAFALLAALFGCSGGEAPRAIEQAVIGGTATGAAHGEVVFVTAVAQGRVKQCSGTLVAPNLVLTALHCVSERNPNEGVLCDDMGESASADNSALLGPPVRPGNVAIYAGPIPGQTADANVIQIIGSGSATICENDLAFLLLDRMLTLPTAPLRASTRASVGEMLVAVGFGQNSTGASQSRQQRQVQVTAVGQWIRTFTVSEGPCFGDSGGPSLTADGELAGVFSTVSLDCAGADAAGKYTDISYFDTLTERAFALANGNAPPDAGTDAAAAGAAATTDLDAGAAGAAGAPVPTPAPETLTARGGCSISASGRTPSALAYCALLAALLYRRKGQPK